MGYEINVSQSGRHYFATAPRSLEGVSDATAMQMFADMLKRFPESEGFAIELTHAQSMTYTVATTQAPMGFNRTGAARR